VNLMAGSSEMPGDETQERRETRIWCGRPEAQLSEGSLSV